MKKQLEKEYMAMGFTEYQAGILAQQCIDNPNKSVYGEGVSSCVAEHNISASDALASLLDSDTLMDAFISDEVPVSIDAE